MTESTEVLVIGGGVIGLSVAYYLAKAGIAATVVDRSDFGQESSWAGAGMLPGNSAKQAKTPLGQLKGLSAAAYPELSAELLELTGIDNGFRRCGGLEVRMSEAALEARRLEQVRCEEADEGHAAQILDRTQLRALEPALAADLPGALYFPQAAQVRNPWHLRALVSACTRRGVTLVPHAAAEQIQVENERITLVRGPGKAWVPGQVVICSGAWSSALLKPLGFDLGVKPVRGQIVLLRSPHARLKAMLMAGPKYVVPREDGRVLIGSTEEDAGFVKANTPEAIADLHAFARALVPAFATDPVERTWAGLRPGSHDKKPLLGPVPGYKNLWVATGHFRSGLQLSPITGILMTQWLQGQPLPIDPKPFLVDRVLYVG